VQVRFASRGAFALARSLPWPEARAPPKAVEETRSKSFSFSNLWQERGGSQG
jgi:hypothetical protein